MKKSIILPLVLISAVFTACSNGAVGTQNPKDEPKVVQNGQSGLSENSGKQAENRVEQAEKDEGSSIQFKPTIIETSAYSLSIPDDWKVEKPNENTLVFKRNHAIIGGLDVLGYYPSEPISQLFSNHEEDTGLKKLDDFEIETYTTKLTIISPAASGKETKEEQLHYYFVDQKNGKAYDLYFHTAQFNDEKVALQITKTFKLLKSNETNSFSILERQS